jgi:hypothetical protein
MSASLKFRLILSTAALLLICCVPVSRAAYTMSFQQVGPDVVATGSGSIDFTDLSFLVSESVNPQIVPFLGTATLGATPMVAINFYDTISGPSSFGPGGPLFADSGSGAGVGLSSTADAVGFPSNYVSGSPLGVSTDTWSSQTFSSLGLTPGTYEYTWGTGLDADSLTLQIGPAVVSAPLPAGCWAALLAIPFAFIARKRIITA